MSDGDNPAALVEHRAEWAPRAAAILAGLRTALDGLEGADTAAFDHIGSTAVPGLAAKPFLDLQIRLSPLPAEEDLLARLAPHGFTRARGARPDSPGVDRDLPRGRIDVDPVVWEKRLYLHEAERVILHVRRRDSPWGLYTVWFRDWMRAHPDERDRYARVKRALSAQQIGKADYDDYTRAKTTFFDDVQSAFESWAVDEGGSTHR